MILYFVIVFYTVAIKYTKKMCTKIFTIAKVTWDLYGFIQIYLNALKVWVNIKRYEVSAISENKSPHL